MERDSPQDSRCLLFEFDQKLNPLRLGKLPTPKCDARGPSTDPSISGGTSVCFNPAHPSRVIAFYRDVLIESQHIANPMEGDQVSRVMRIKLNFSFQLGDMNINRTGIRTIFLSPNIL